MWGNPELGVLRQCARYGGGVPQLEWFFKSDISRIRRWVRSLHGDPLPYSSPSIRHGWP